MKNTDIDFIELFEENFIYFEGMSYDDFMVLNESRLNEIRGDSRILKNVVVPAIVSLLCSSGLFTLTHKEEIKNLFNDETTQNAVVQVMQQTDKEKDIEFNKDTKETENKIEDDELLEGDIDFSDKKVKPVVGKKKSGVTKKKVLKKKETAQTDNKEIKKVSLQDYIKPILNVLEKGEAEAEKTGKQITKEIQKSLDFIKSKNIDKEKVSAVTKKMTISLLNGAVKGLDAYTQTLQDMKEKAKDPETKRTIDSAIRGIKFEIEAIKQSVEKEQLDIHVTVKALKHDLKKLKEADIETGSLEKIISGMEKVADVLENATAS